MFGSASRNPSRLRWVVGLLLFASTIINYLDRQTLSLLAPYLKTSFHWTNTDYANLIIAFRVAYTLCQSFAGRFIDRVGTRRGLSLTVIFYSIASILTPLANGLLGFMGFRFLLGAGESANWPGATKAVAEWFPAEERALATAFFDSGSSVGGAIAPFLVLFVYFHYGWRPAFIVPGILGVLWLVAWRALPYKPLQPQEHPAPNSLETIDPHTAPPGKLPRWSALLRMPECWAVMLAKGMSDPVWFFVGDWFPIYLVSKGFDLRGSLVAVWVPFLAADAGNFASGALSVWLMRRGMRLMTVRKVFIILGGLGTLLLIPTIFATSLWQVTALFALSTFSYACFSTMANVLPSDLFPQEAVATVSGLSGTTAGLGTIIAMLIVGRLTDARQSSGTHSFDPIMVACGLVPTVGMIMVLVLLRRASASGLSSHKLLDS
jgi:ACS family hexuronate transporter-like MFS transporter